MDIPLACSASTCSQSDLYKNFVAVCLVKSWTNQISYCYYFTNEMSHNIWLVVDRCIIFQTQFVIFPPAGLLFAIVEFSYLLLHVWMCERLFWHGSMSEHFLLKTLNISATVINLKFPTKLGFFLFWSLCGISVEVKWDNKNRNLFLYVIDW